MFIAKTRSIAFVLPIDRVQNDQATKLLKRSIEVKVVRNSNANKQIFKMTKHLPDYPSLPHSDNPFIFDGSFKVTSKVQLIGLRKLIKNRAKIHLQEKLAKT